MSYIFRVFRSCTQNPENMGVSAGSPPTRVPILELREFGIVTVLGSHTVAWVNCQRAAVILQITNSI